MKEESPKQATELDRPESRDAEVLDKVDSPPAFVEKAMAQFLGVARGPSYHPIFEKFTAEHVTKFLDQTHEDDQSEQTFRRSGRRYAFAYFIVALAAFGSLTVFLLPDRQDLYVEFLKLGVVFAGGLGSGYGIKSHLDKKPPK